MKMQRRKKTPLERVNPAQAQIRQAFNLIRSEHMTASCVDVALAQLGVAYKNLEDYRRFILRGTAKPSSAKAAGQLLAIANSLPRDAEECSLAPIPMETQAITVETYEDEPYAP